MRTQESSDELSFKTTLLENLVVGSPLRVASIVFQKVRMSVEIHSGVFERVAREIPFSWIREVRHYMGASFVQDGEKGGLELRPYPHEAHYSELSLGLIDRTEEVFYRRGLRMKWEGRDGRDQIPLIQGMADRICSFTGIPGAIVSDELQGTFNMGSRMLTLHGECLPPAIRGLSIAFGEIAAIRWIRAADTYYAVEIRRKQGGVVAVNKGYAWSTRMHETARMIADRAGIPFEAQETETGPSSAERPYKPIAPTFKGFKRSGSGTLRRF